MVDETYNTWFGKFYAIIVGGSGGMGGYLTFPVRTGDVWQGCSSGEQGANEPVTLVGAYSEPLGCVVGRGSVSRWAGLEAAGMVGQVRACVLSRAREANGRAWRAAPLVGRALCPLPGATVCRSTLSPVSRFRPHHHHQPIQ